MRCKECKEYFQSEYEMQEVCGECAKPEEVKFEPPYPGDLTELLRFAWAASRGKHPMHLRPSEVERCDEYLRSPAPRSTYQRVSNAVDTEFEQLRAIKTAAQAYIEAVSGEPEKDCWDTPDGKEAPDAERFASDWSWREYDAKKQKAFDELRAALGEKVTEDPA